jgi:hypothetical protein
MKVLNPLQEALRELAELLAEQSHFLHAKATPVEEWTQSPALRRIVQKLWDQGVSWGYERSMAEGREQDEARGWTLVRIEKRVKELPHGDIVDGNGRPRPCPQEWPGGPCECYRAKVLAIIQEEMP